MVEKIYHGKIYKFNLDFNLNSSFIQLIDKSILSDFDGRLVIVFNNFDNPDIDINNTSLLLGPIVVNKFPPINGNRKFKLFGESEVKIKSFKIKDLRGLLFKNNDWSKLTTWMTYDLFNSDEKSDIYDYESIRHLETPILNHIDSIIQKTTMLYLLKLGKNVNDYYDLSELGNRNLYIQLMSPLRKVLDI